MSDLARALLDELAADPVALDRLRELVGEMATSADVRPPAYTVGDARRRARPLQRSIRRRSPAASCRRSSAGAAT